MATINTKHKLTVPAGGINLDGLPAQTYIFQCKSVFGPYIKCAPAAAPCDATAVDFFTAQEPEKLPGNGEANPLHPNGLVFKVQGGDRVALRTLEAEVGNFKQHSGSGSAAVLAATTEIEIIGETAFSL